MTLEVTAWAPTREAAIAFLEAISVATVDEAGHIQPIADVLIHPARPEETLAVMDVDGNLIPGWHFNLRFYDPPNRPGSYTTLTAGLPQTDADGAALGLFERSRILDLVQARVGTAPNWIALSDDPIPPGYRVDDPLSPYDDVRAYDPALIATRRNIWA